MKNCICTAGGMPCRLGRGRGQDRCEGCAMGNHAGHALPQPGPGKPVEFTAPELPTRAERDVEKVLNAIDSYLRERDYHAALKVAQRLVIEVHSLAIFGRQGVDAIPVDEAAWEGAPAEMLAKTHGELVVPFEVAGRRRFALTAQGLDKLGLELLADEQRAAARQALGYDEPKPSADEIADHKNREGSWDAPAGAGADVEADRG